MWSRVIACLTMPSTIAWSEELLTPQEQVLNSLRLFAKEVMPHFEKKPSQAEAAAAAAGAR